MLFALLEGALLLLWILSPTSLEGLFPKILGGIALFDRFDSFSGGMFDITALVTYAAVIAMMLFCYCAVHGKEEVELMKQINIKEWFRFDKQKFKEGFKSRAFRVGGYSATACVVVAAIAIAAVLIVDALPSSYTKLDITSNQMFSLSEQTKAILQTQDREVDFYLIAQQGKEDANILELLNRYKDLNDKVKVSTVDPVLYPSFTQQYTDTSVSENSVLVVSGDRSYVGKLLRHL